jgi:hypothetical protein
VIRYEDSEWPSPASSAYIRAPRLRAEFHSYKKAGPFAEQAIARRVERTAARSGVSLSGERADRRQNPERPIGLIIESKPPASAQSTLPRRMSFIAVPSAWPPDAHAVCTEVE